MKYLIVLFLSFTAYDCYAQLFESGCDNLRTCYKQEPEINKIYASLNSDTIVTYSTYGGPGCMSIDIIICYKESSEFKFLRYRKGNFSQPEKLTKKKKKVVISFLEDQLYMSPDTLNFPVDYAFIDDGVHTSVTYRFAKHCGTYNFMPEYNRGKVYG